MDNNFMVKDSGERRHFDTGAVRDKDDNKPKLSLLPVLSLLRIGMLYTRGAKKYDSWNWAKGMPYSEFMNSAMRHLFAFLRGDTDEDHLSAICFNIMSIIHFQELGRKDLDDLTPLLEMVYKNGSNQSIS